MKIIKMDGRAVKYDRNKIFGAIMKAMKCSEGGECEEIANRIVNRFETSDLSKKESVNVEEIQDFIEMGLMKSSRKDAAKEFIIYREERSRVRMRNSALIKEVARKLKASNIENQNANVDEMSFGGKIGEAARVVTKDFALENCMSKKSRENHINNRIYIHDLDSYAVGCHNCLTFPFDDILAKGCSTRQTDIRPAQSINTAFQLVAVLFQLQSLNQFGGVSASHLDWTMVPYVRKSFEKHYVTEYVKGTEGFMDMDFESIDKDELEHWVGKQVTKFFMESELSDDDFRFDNKEKLDRVLYQKAMYETRKELYQSVEGMYHNLNTLQSRSGNQLPFTSINYGTCTLPEGRMVTRALLDGSISGVGKNHLTPIFPCGIFQVMKGVNKEPGTVNYDLYRLALKSTAKRIYPNYANVDWSGNAGYDKNDPRTYFSTMGCHAPGTKVIMFDGTKKNVEDVTVGDELMGINGEKRTVQSLISGHGEMFLVKQSRGEDYCVNRGHILALEYSATAPYRGFKKGDKVNMSVDEYLKIPYNHRRLFKGYKSSFELKDSPTRNFSTSTLHIEQIEDGDFYGFELDGDRLYMINDGTVTHNCRTANGFDINGLGQLKDGRGNICPVTIIMPTLAMEAEGDTEKFMKILDKAISDAKDMLIERFEWICSQKAESAKFMYENGIMAGYVPEEGIRSALKHGTLAVGQLGLAETLQILIGCDHTTAKGMELAKRIEGLFKDRCLEYKEEYKLNFGVYFTPAENLCHTALKKFKEKYGVIPNVSDRKFFTNSIHVPVWKEMNPFEKVDIESQLTGFSSAGCITYAEFPSSAHNNIDALETFVNYSMDKDIPYIAINLPHDMCTECGYIGDLGDDECPKCGSDKILHLARVTGYLTGDYKTSFNDGKIEEKEERVKHIKG